MTLPSSLSVFWAVPAVAALALLAAGAAGGCTSDPAPAPEAPPNRVEGKVVEAVEAIDAMRSGLAQTVTEPKVDRETFARVCKPVGQRAQAVGQRNGWTVQQLARKYRNPAHRLDSTAADVYETFAADTEQTSTWVRVDRPARSGWRYFRRITVEPSCLACHGAKADRPDFVKAGYPDDRAYGFEPGDLRGLYSVFVPDSVATDESRDPANE